MKYMRKALALMLVLVFGLAGSALAAVKVGVVGPHSGDLAPYGLPTKDAVEMYVAKINAAGGLLGAPVEVVYMDDQCKPGIAASVATKVVSLGVDAIVGPICSGAAKAALGIYNEAHIISISPAATNPPLTQSGEYPNFFRTIAPDNEQGKLAADFVVNKLGVKKVALIHDKGDYGKGFVDFCKKYLEAAGAKVVMYEGITPGAMDYSAVVQKVRREGAQALVFGGYHPEASKLVKQMKRRRMRIPFIGPDGIKGNGFLDIAGADAEGVYATGPMDVSQLPLNVAVKAAYTKRFGKEPGTFFDQGYAAIQAYLAAVKAAGSTDYQAVSAALRNDPVETTVGKIHFDAKGDAVGVGFSVYQVKGGRFVELK